MSAVYEPGKSLPYDEDLRLVERATAGDMDAFQTLYERYHDKVFAIARGILLDHEEAADAVQEIFTLVYRHLARFDRRSKFSTWLFRIAVNRSIQQARRGRSRRHQVPLTEAYDKAEDAPEIEAEDPAIAAAMARLHPSDRALLTLFYWDELSLHEIADSLGCSANAAKTRLFRARERFRTFYEGGTS
ncbi:MAG: RNA polymerase sigma factor [Fimbriimonadaceae bacterium]|nr:RNA polymerase sigma factor [Fimbriimonadaceae bacterium]